MWGRVTRPKVPLRESAPFSKCDTPFHELMQHNGKPLHKATMESTWLRIFRHVGKIPRRKGPVGSRYGYNLHEMRDVATTYLHVKAKADGLDMDCVKLANA